MPNTDGSLSYEIRNMQRLTVNNLQCFKHVHMYMCIHNCQLQCALLSVLCCTDDVICSEAVLQLHLYIYIHVQ